MTSAFGSGFKPESSEARALRSINQDSYDYRDQGKLLTKLTGDVSYMAQYMRTMQKGIDDANQNVIEQITGFINEILVVIGGSGNTGFDFGDLKYIFQAIGSLFGFDQQTGIAAIFPINLFSAGWHFFSTYVLPLNNFGEAIDNFIDMGIATMLDVLGEIPIVGQAAQQVAVWITDFRDALQNGYVFLNGLFSDWTAPLVSAVKAVVNVVQQIVDWLTGIVNSAFSNLFPWAKRLPQMNTTTNTIEGANIPSLDASKVTSGRFSKGVIPDVTRDMSSDLQSTINNVYSGWYGTTGTGTPLDVASTMGAIKASINSVWTSQTLTSSGTWTRPWTPGDGTEPKEFWAICVGGGGGGRRGRANGSSVSLSGGLGGLGGGYCATQINVDELPPTISYTVGSGTGGTTSWTTTRLTGQASSFGGFATSDAQSGVITSLFGIYDASGSQPGVGGDGGAGGPNGGTDGGSTPLAPGGAGGTNGNGQQGTDATLTSITRCGGGGGGGGSGGGASGGGTGGTGGFPGGGGGGGGSIWYAPLASFGANGGNGANGAIILMWK